MANTIGRYSPPREGVSILEESPRREKLKIGRILHLKSEIRNMRLDYASLVRPQDLEVQLEISDFGFEVQDSSNISKFLPAFNGGSFKYVNTLVRGDWRRQVNRSEERSEQTAIPHRSTEPHS